MIRKPWNEVWRFEKIGQGGLGPAVSRPNNTVAPTHRGTVKSKRRKNPPIFSCNGARRGIRGPIFALFTFVCIFEEVNALSMCTGSLKLFENDKKGRQRTNLTS